MQPTKKAADAYKSFSIGRDRITVDGHIFPNHAKAFAVDEVLEAFVGQFYSDKTPPFRLILTSHRLPNHSLVNEALSIQADNKVQISQPQRGTRKTLSKAPSRMPQIRLRASFRKRHPAQITRSYSRTI